MQPLWIRVVLCGWYGQCLVLFFGLCCEEKMNDLFRAIFGIPSSDQNGERMDSRVPQGYRSNYGGNSGDDDDDDDFDDENNVNMRGGPQGGIFGFPLFNEPVEFHRQLGRFINDMNKVFGVFGFSSGKSITWEGGIDNDSSVFREDGNPKQSSLRDAYLKKTDCSCNKIGQSDDINLNLNIKTGDFEPGTSSNSNSVIQYSYPKVYSKSIFIQTVRRPDGSVETIKKVKDHEGNEETTISQSHVSDPLPPVQDQLIPKEDTSGLSIFKKFFSKYF